MASTSSPTPSTDDGTDMASISSPTPSTDDGTGIKHDVFLSFRGEDTRKNFTAHLYAALRRKGIDAYIDDRLDGGEKIETLFSKISESLVSVVIFSPNYAGSHWCLDELAKIAECRDAMGQRVLPVFLGVEPTHIRKQAGAFGEAFLRLLTNPQHKHREDTWRRAMLDIAKLSGWDSKNKSEVQIIEEIVSSIEKILNQLSQTDLGDGFVGSTRIRKVESLLCIGSPERIISVGIWGMGGIGKTAIAKIVFYSKSNAFDGACFLENVREKFKREGPDSIQKDMLAQLLEVDNSNKSLHLLSPLVQRKLRRKKVIIVLDDVSTPRQLKALVGRCESFSPGSRIIVTSRDKQVLKNGCTEVYEVEKLNNREALQLFKFHAFKESQLAEKFIELSKKAVAYAQGLPLALEVLGCNLYGKGLKEWESELAKLQETPNMKISDVLRIASNGLEEKEKEHLPQD